MRMKAENRYSQMLSEAARLYREGGDEAVNTLSVAKACNCTHPLVLYYFGSADELRRRAAVIANGGTL